MVADWPSTGRVAGGREGAMSSGGGGSVTGNVTGSANGGGAEVVNVRSAPSVVPAALVATTRKWYVVAGASPLTTDVTDCVDEPLPALEAAVLDPYPVVRPHSKL